MTNAIVTLQIATALVTNWTTVSYTAPAPKPLAHIITADYNPTMANQVGSVISNRVGRFEWKGQTREVILESVEIGRLTRSIDAHSGVDYSTLFR